MRCQSEPAPGAIDDEPGKRKHEQELAELRWLETEEGKFEGAPRAARREAEDEDERDAHAEEGVDADPQLAEARVVDAGEEVHADDAEQQRRVACRSDVVVGVAGNVVQGRLAEREDAEDGKGRSGEGQGAVHVGQAEALGDAGTDREGLGPGLAGAGRVHQPSPPFVAASFASRLGEIRFEDLLRRGRRRFDAEAAFLHRHEGDDTRIRVRGEDAVPGLVRVAGALGGAGLAGDRDREAAEDCRTRSRSPFCAASCSPSRIAARYSGSMGTCAARLGVEFLQHPAGRVVDLQADVGGDDRAAVGERRVGDRHLQRVGLQVALPGGELHVVSRRPGPFGPAFAFLVELSWSRQCLLGSRPSSAPGRSMPVGRPMPSAWAQCCSSPVSHIRRPSV